MRRHGIIILWIGLLLFLTAGSGEGETVLAQDAGGGDGVFATDIIETLRSGSGIDLVNTRVRCNQNEALNFTLLAEPDDNRLVINLPIKITDSVIECDVIAVRSETAPLDVRFRELVNFTGTRFEGRVNVTDVEFDKGTNFTDAQFENGANFNSTIFDQTTAFDRASFRGVSPFFTATVFEKDVSFSGARFGSGYPLSFDQVRFGGNTIFSNAVFTSSVAFSYVEFGSDTDFSSVQLARAKFTDVDFDGTASFRFMTTDGNLSFETAHFVGDVSFEQAVVNGEFTLDNTSFDNAARFPDVTFEDSFQMNNSNIGGEAVFTGVPFRGEVVVSDSTFAGSARFREAVFADRVRLSTSSFGDYASFRDAVFGEGLALETVTFNDETTFENAVFSGETIFSGTAFVESAQFTRANFQDRADFVDVSFSSLASFRSADFRDGVVFRSCDFDVLNLTAIDIDDQELDLFDARYNRLVAHDFDFEWVKTSTEDFQTAFAIGIFADLEANFRAQGRETLANEAYLRKWQTECDIADFWSPIGLGCQMGRGIGFLVQPWRVIQLSIVIYLIFAFIYIVLGIRRKVDRSESVEIRFAKQKDGNLLLVPGTLPRRTEPEDLPPPGLWDRIKAALELSFAAFLYLRRPKGQAPFDNVWAGRLVMHSVVTVEWILGYYALIGLAMTIANTAPLFGEFVSQFR